MPEVEYVRVKLSDIQDIADAIRAALGIDVSSTFKVGDMAELITRIASGENKNVTDIYNAVTSMNTTVGNNTEAVIANTTAVQNAVTKFYEFNNPVAQSYTLDANTDKTFVGVSTSLAISVPSGIAHGYIAGANIINPANGLVTTLANNSSYSLKLIRSGVAVATITANNSLNISQYLTNSIERFVFDCDGNYVYAYLTEVEDE